MTDEVVKDVEQVAEPANSIISVRNVNKIFPGKEGDVIALSGSNLKIASGEFVSLIGPSGCGKTTLLRLIADLEKITSGELLVNHKSPERARLDRDYGYVFQAPVLYEWRTVLKNVELPLEIMGTSASKRKQTASRLLEMVGLEQFKEHYPWQLSGGMQQRVSIARALSFSPSILLMDEPFGALDEITREQMQQEVLRLWRETQTTTVFVTHSISEAVFLSTHVVMMSARPGRITEIIDIDLPQPRNVETRESERFYELVTEVREALRRSEQASG